MSYFTTFKIKDNIYQFKDKLGVLTTLIIGDDKALLVDTAYGIGDLKEHISSITNKPLIVIASHGHMDHTGGNYQFDEVYIKKEDINLCKKHNSLPWRKRNIESAQKLNALDTNFNIDNYLLQTEGNLKEVIDNQIFNLGNTTVEIISMEGHTKGSIGAYIKEEKILVVTDATCPFVWLFLEESTTVDIYIKMLERVLKLDFDYVLLGHGAGQLVERKRVYEFLEVAKNINMEESVKVSFNNFEDVESYCYTKGVMYNQDHAGIVFDPKKLK